MAQKQIIKQQAPIVFDLQNPQTSVAQSLQFLQKMTIIAISGITFHRKLFPEDAFLDKIVDGARVKILRSLDNLPGTKKMIEWLKYAFKLVSQQHLHKLILVIEKEKSHKGENQNHQLQNIEQALETYIVKFSYNEEEICYQLVCEDTTQKSSISNQSSKLPEDIKSSVHKFLRSMTVMTSTLKPLPIGCEFSLRLELEDNTPDDFEQSELFMMIERQDFTFPQGVEPLKLGKIPSRFTTFTLSVKSALSQIDKESELEEEDDDTDSPLPALSLLSSGNQSSLSKKKSQDLTRESDDEMIILSDELSLRLSSVSIENKIINCICGCQDDRFGDSTKCVGCSTYQHRSCYNLPMSRKSNDSHHICVLCHNPTEGKLCSNTDLIGNQDLKGDALYRRALLLCMDEDNISTNKIMKCLKVSRQKAQSLYNKLDFDGCFYFAQGGRSGKRVDKEHIEKNVFHRYFTAPITSFNKGQTIGTTDINQRKRSFKEVNESLDEEAPTQQDKRAKIFKV